jgi:N6-adenosine-specific RNA methylase IME4
MTLYKTIVADPPWAETGGGKICRGAQKHYAVVKDKDIESLIRAAPCWHPDESCHFWLWVTNNRLPLGFQIMANLGFRYVTNLCWTKDRFGIGQYLRGQHELCLFGVRGETMLPTIRNVPSVVMAPRGEHSAKPHSAYEYIKRVSPEPRLEMFARGKRLGFDVWGNEAQTDEIFFV